MQDERKRHDNGNPLQLDRLSFDGMDMETIIQAVTEELSRKQRSSRPIQNESSESHRPPSNTREKEISAEKIQKILQMRANALARVNKEESTETTQLVVFSLSNEKYGIATHQVREVQPLRQISPVPCTPDFVIGVINIRGAIYSVIDIREFLGAPDNKLTESTKVILVKAADLEVGIMADDVLGEISIPLHQIKPPLATRGGYKEEYVQGVTREMLSILNLDALLRDERIIIHEEVG